MKQKFSTSSHKVFKKLLNIKERPGKIEKKLLQKAKKHLTYIRYIPGIKMIGVGNSISMNNAHKDSDIDLFIVVSPNRLWFVRITITLIFEVLGLRKTGKKHAGKFCLSFFATTDGLDFSEFAIKDDIYLYFWLIYMQPIIDNDNTYQKFLKINTSWTDITQYSQIIEKNKKSITYIGKTLGENSKVFSYIDTIFKKRFLPKTLGSFEKLGKPFGVIISDDMLKFHDQDRRKEISKTLGF